MSNTTETATKPCLKHCRSSSNEGRVRSHTSHQATADVLPPPARCWPRPPPPLNRPHRRPSYPSKAAPSVTRPAASPCEYRDGPLLQTVALSHACLFDWLPFSHTHSPASCLPFHRYRKRRNHMSARRPKAKNRKTTYRNVSTATK